MIVTSMYSNAIEHDYADARELSDEERMKVQNHISSIEGKWHDYDALISGFPKKGVVPAYNDRQIVRHFWSFKYQSCFVEDSHLTAIFQK